MSILTVLVACLFALNPLVSGAPSPALQAPAVQADTPPLPHLFVDDPSGALDPAVGVMPFERVLAPEDADTILLNGTLTDGKAIRALALDGASVVLVLGPDVAAEQLSALLDQPVSLAARSDAISAQAVAESENPSLAHIQWNSAPQMRERWSVTGAEIVPLVTGFDSDELLLGSVDAGAGKVYLITPVLAGDDNHPLREWAYFNYLVYALSVPQPAPFAEYAGSPVPQPAERLAILALLLAIMLTAGGAFFVVRRYSLRHPESLDLLVVDPERFRSRQEEAGWEEVGFHRPLGGFLLAVMFGLLFFVPLIIYQNLILPSYILPSAQALGIWGRVTQFFNVAWLFFDFGTSAAFVKFMAEYRVKDPRRGIMYGQLFVWWQALSGAVQVALIVLVASTVLPRSAYAIYSWSIILHAFIQIPGFYLVYRNALAGLQRFDYAQLLDMAEQAFLPMVMQIPIVYLMVRWGQGHPVFGPAMGGLLGMGLAAYGTELATFLFGWLLWRRIGLRSRVLFLAHFDAEVVRSGFRFGGFEMLGSIAWAAGQAAEVAITQHKLVNYAETWGNWVIAQNFIFAYNVINILFYNLVASISEAISHGRRILSEYYAAQAFRYGAFFSAFIAAVLFAVADRFILGATGPEFERAALFATPLILWGAIQYPSWIGDAVQLGSNRPYLKAILVAGEQVIRVTLAAIFVTRFQIWALIGAYFVGLLTKDVASFLINDRICFRQRLYVWPALIAPLLAGAVHFALLRWLSGLIWQGDQITSVLVLFIGILLSFPLFSFLYALFGGWDGPGLAELRRGAGLAGPMRPLALAFWWSSEMGQRVSPLRGRSGISIQRAADGEAAGLMAERVELARSA
jgi:O-antigen/teichoic acid export membrane protein